MARPQLADSPLALTSDGALVLDAAGSALDAVRVWLPRSVGARAGSVALAKAVIRVEWSETSLDSVPHPGTRGRVMSLGPVVALGDSSSSITLDGPMARGVVDLAARVATLRVSATGVASDVVQSMMTLSAALLLNRIGRALVHSAAVVDPAGRGWLLVGDSHSGKSTTCATLLTAGWRFSSDDHVVIGAEIDGPVTAEGWPRAFHLDRGWDSGISTGERLPIDPERRWPAGWTPSIDVHALAFTSIDAGARTRATAMSAVDALASLIRQSPWLAADADVARDSLRLLSRVASLPACRLVLARDSYATPSVLADQLTSFETTAPEGWKSA